jgi:hypothetical protein
VPRRWAIRCIPNDACQSIKCSTRSGRSARLPLRRCTYMPVNTGTSVCSHSIRPWRLGVVLDDELHEAGRLGVRQALHEMKGHIDPRRHTRRGDAVAVLPSPLGPGADAFFRARGEAGSDQPRNRGRAEPVEHGQPRRGLDGWVARGVRGAAPELTGFGTFASAGDASWRFRCGYRHGPITMVEATYRGRRWSR